MDEPYLYHYYEKTFKPFSPLTALPYREAKAILLKEKAEGRFKNPDIDAFLRSRYDRDAKLREMFVRGGGKPRLSAPVYMMLGEHRQWESAYENPSRIRIPLREFDPATLSFTYGDSFAVLNPALFDASEYWN